MRYSANDIAKIVKNTRKRLDITQEQLALAAGTGARFIVDLERGKPTCELGKTLQVINALGIRMTLDMPILAGDGRGDGPRYEYGDG